MIEAIVYRSQTGHTRRYAEMFATKTGLPCLEADEARRQLPRGMEIIYFGWLMAGAVKGYAKAEQYFQVRALAAVGMRFLTDAILHEIKERHHLGDRPVFYCMGGVDMEKLGWFYRQMLSFAAKMLAKAAAKEDASPDTVMAAKDFVLGKDYVSEEHLQPLLAWYQAN